METPVPRNAYDRERLPVDFDGVEDMAKQSFKDEVDVNNIMAKYQTTGAITHFNTYQASYGDATSVTFQEAMNLATSTQEMFNDLPSSLRTKFGNSPAQFLDFVQDPANAEEMIELGLATQPEWPPEDPAAAAAAATKAAEAAATPPADPPAEGG